jgi:hypothetical protein
MDPSGRILVSQRTELKNNVLTIVTFPPVAVRTGAVYSLRVTNLSPDVLGVILNSPAKNGHIASANARAYLEKELPNPEPHFDATGALAGRVLGIS